MADMRSTTGSPTLQQGRGRKHRTGRLVLHALTVSALAVGVLFVNAMSGLAADRIVETSGSIGSYHWNPSSAEVSPGGTVEFKNMDGTHAVVWESGPETPSCPGVPSLGQANWSGTCTFTSSGTYQFHCPVHPTEMTGTITVSGPMKPTVTTEAPTAVTDTGATLRGKVNPEGQETKYFFEYGTAAPAYGQETEEKPAGEGSTSESKSEAITGLSPRTTYHFRMVAKNATGTTLGADQTFTTTGAPLATTEAAAPVIATGATLRGTVNPEGHTTTYYFKYGTSIAYGQETKHESAGEKPGSVAVSAPISLLAPNTTYHFRLVAVNISGPTEGTDLSFKTTPGLPVVTTGQASDVTETGATLNGTVNPEGQETTYYFNYGTTSAYGQKTGEQSAGNGTTGAAVSAAASALAANTTYHFQLVAVNGGGEAKGLDHALTTFAPPPPATPPPSREQEATPPPAPGPALGSTVKVIPGHHGAPLSVSVQVLESGAAGKLEITLFFKGGGSRNAVAGHLVRSGISSGKQTLKVPLNGRAKRTLRQAHRLSLTVKIKLTSPAGTAMTIKRSIVLRG